MVKQNLKFTLDFEISSQGVDIFKSLFHDFIGHWMCYEASLISLKIEEGRVAALYNRIP